MGEREIKAGQMEECRDGVRSHLLSQCRATLTGDNDEKRTARDEQLTAIDRTTIDVEIVRRSVVEATGDHPVVHGTARTTYSVCRKRDANVQSVPTTTRV